MEIIIIYVLVLALIALFPMVLDVLLAYYSLNKTRREIIDKLIEKASLNKLGIGELKELLKEGGKAPTGIGGLARTTMALTVIMILGIAVFHVLVTGVSGGNSQTNSQIVNNILSMLTGLLAAITGFYFGGRTAEKAAGKEGEEGKKTAKEEEKKQNEQECH